jgi:hypothetical protein
MFSKAGMASRSQVNDRRSWAALRKLARIKPNLQRYFVIHGLSGSLNTRHSYPGGAMERRELAFVIAILIASAAVSVATLFEVAKLGIGLL